MSDKLLIAVDQLISAYEKYAIKRIPVEKEAALNVLEMGNLTSASILLEGMNIANTVDFVESLEEARRKTNVEEIKQEVLNECSEMIEEEELESIISRSQVPPVPGSEDAQVRINVSKRGKERKFNLKKYLEGTNLPQNIKEYDFARCLRCNIDIDLSISMPAYDMIWNFGTLLRAIKDLLKKVKLSFSPDLLLKNICDFINMGKLAGLCPSTWPQLALSIPVLIDKHIRGLFELTFNWTSLIGGIIAPILSIADYFVSVGRHAVLSVFNCLVGLLNTAKNISLSFKEGIKRLVDDNINNSVQGAKAISRDVEAAYRYTEEKLNSMFEKTPGASDREAIGVRRPQAKAEEATVEKAKTDELAGKNIFERTKVYSERVKSWSREANTSLNYQYKGLKLKEEAEQKIKVANLASTLDPVIEAFAFAEEITIKARDSVLEVFDTISYACKAFTVFVQEPLMLRAELFAEIRLLLNLARLYSLIIELVKNGLSSCEDLRNRDIINEEVLKNSDLEKFGLNVKEKENGDLEIVLNDIKQYSSSIKLYSCDDIFNPRNTFDEEVDNMYEILSKNL